MKTTLKCDPITVIILIIVGGALFTVGFFVGKNTVPIVNNNSYINYAEASANAYASGVQMIAVDYGGIAQVNFAFDGITNFNIQTISTNGVTNNYKNPDDLPPEIQAQIKKAKKLIPK